jgi:hypothetical protein
MGLFKKKVVKEIEGGLWGHLVSVHKIDVDTISNTLRCVEREGMLNDKVPVKFVRIFKPAEAQAKSVAIEGWETFDQHPELVHFEGYLTGTNQASLERKRN